MKQRVINSFANDIFTAVKQHHYELWERASRADNKKSLLFFQHEHGHTRTRVTRCEGTMLGTRKTLVLRFDERSCRRSRLSDD